MLLEKHTPMPYFAVLGGQGPLVVRLIVMSSLAALEKLHDFSCHLVGQLAVALRL